MTKSLEDRIAYEEIVYEDALLHECEKYVDECAMRAMQGMSGDSNNGLALGKIAELSYDIAELMLEEKLKRKRNKQ